MKFVAVGIFAAIAVCSSLAFGAETNAERLARGLTPLPPHRREDSTPAHVAKRTTPSTPPRKRELSKAEVLSTAGHACPGMAQCCDSTGYPHERHIGVILDLLEVTVQDGSLVGLNCHPYTPSRTCPSPLCCSNDEAGGLVAIDCMPALA